MEGRDLPNPVPPLIPHVRSLLCGSDSVLHHQRRPGTQNAVSFKKRNPSLLQIITGEFVSNETFILWLYTEQFCKEKRLNSVGYSFIWKRTDY